MLVIGQSNWIVWRISQIWPYCVVKMNNQYLVCFSNFVMILISWSQDIVSSNLVWIILGTNKWDFHFMAVWFCSPLMIPKPIIQIHNRACAVNISSVLTFLSSLLNFSKTTNCTHLINSYSFVVFEKFSLCLLTPNCTKIHVNTTTKCSSLTSFSFFSLQIKTSLRMFKTSTKLGTPIHSKIFIQPP